MSGQCLAGAGTQACLDPVGQLGLSNLRFLYNLESPCLEFFSCFSDSSRVSVQTHCLFLVYLTWTSDLGSELGWDAKQVTTQARVARVASMLLVFGFDMPR